MADQYDAVNRFIHTISNLSSPINRFYSGLGGLQKRRSELSDLFNEGLAGDIGGA